MRRMLAIVSLLGLGACATIRGAEHDHYVVFFTEWSAQLDPAAKAIVAAAADSAKADAAMSVSVEGYADQVGSVQANTDISRARAQVVTDELIADGVPSSRISRSGKGGTAHPDITAQASRRVDIVLAR